MVTQGECCVNTTVPRGLIPALGPSDLDPQKRLVPGVSTRSLGQTKRRPGPLPGALLLYSVRRSTKNFPSKYVGETEGNLERALSVLQAMGPVMVVIDEADAATVGSRLH